MPLVHVGGLSIVVRSAIYATTARVLERFDVERALGRWSRRRRRSSRSCRPRCAAARRGLARAAALRAVLLGGGGDPPALLERAAAAGVPVATTYGMTEACSQIATAGTPLFCTRVEIARRRRDRRPRADRLARRVGGGGCTPATWARSTPAARLQITGRKADTIISGGENVAPTEVEAVLAEHPAVAEAAVHGRPDPQWGEAVVATVVVRGAVEAEELRAFGRAGWRAYKVPKAIAFTDALPRTGRASCCVARSVSWHARSIPSSSASHPRAWEGAAGAGPPRPSCGGRDTAGERVDRRGDRAAARPARARARRRSGRRRPARRRAGCARGAPRC